MSDLTPSHQDNLLRWDGSSPSGMYESHFIKVNLPEERAAFWWKFTVLQGPGSDAEPAFEVWAIFFDVENPERSCAAKETFGLSDAEISRDRLRCRYGPNILEHGHSSGELFGEHRFAWRVDWTPPVEAFRLFNAGWMYEGAFPKTKALTPAPTTTLDGEVEVDGRRFTLSGHRGMQGHNWGQKHADSWVWVHSNLFDQDPGVVFEAVSSRVRVAGVRSPQLTILHVDDGHDDPITVNGWVGMVRTHSDLRGLRWAFRGTQGPRAVEGAFQAPAARFVGVDYRDPDGTVTHCLNSKVADGELRILHRDRRAWRVHSALTTTASAALEIGVKGDTRGVRLHLK